MLQILTLAQKGLSIFRSYVVAQEMVSIIATNITLLELKQKHYVKQLQILKDKQ